MNTYKPRPKELATEYLESYILENNLKAHDRLPPERELSQMWNLNRVTLRSAIASMEAAGRLYSVQGRGTMVAPRFVRTLQNLESFTKYASHYEAKSEMNKAKSYRERMKMKRDELRDAKYAVQKIPDFICEEQKQIDELMWKFRKTADAINNSDTAEKVESLNKIAKLIADLLTTQFIENNYEITAQYMTVHKRISEINNSLSGCAWLIGG